MKRPDGPCLQRRASLRARKSFGEAAGFDNGLRHRIRLSNVFAGITSPKRSRSVPPLPFTLLCYGPVDPSHPFTAGASARAGRATVRHTQPTSRPSTPRAPPASTRTAASNPIQSSQSISWPCRPSLPPSPPPPPWRPAGRASGQPQQWQQGQRPPPQQQQQGPRAPCCRPDV